MRATFRGGPVHPAIPPPPSDDAARALRLRDVLAYHGVQTRARCRVCGHVQPFAGITLDGLCIACSLGARLTSGVEASSCLCCHEVVPADTMTEGLCPDCDSYRVLCSFVDNTEPLLSSERDTRDTRDTIPTVDWAE